MKSVWKPEMTGNSNKYNKLRPASKSHLSERIAPQRKVSLTLCLQTFSLLEIVVVPKKQVKPKAAPIAPTAQNNKNKGDE